MSRILLDAAIISGLFLKELLKRGVDIGEIELKTHRHVDSLSAYISNKYSMAINEADLLINESLSEAFNKKYSAYDYTNDARGVDDAWVSNFYQIYQKNDSLPIENQRIVNVGVGGGTEAVRLFSQCKI